MDNQDASDQISVWIERLAAGDERAPDVIWLQYFEKIQRFAKKRLRDMPRRSADEQDVALSAFNSFFHAAKEDKFPKLSDRDDLWKILITITARKATAHQRKHFAEKRGGGRVSGESVFLRVDDAGGGLHQCLGEAPTPEFVAEMEEQCDYLLDQLGDDLLRQIAEAKFEGFSNEEIAVTIGKNVRTVERKLSLIREIWSSSAGMNE